MTLEHSETESMKQEVMMGKKQNPSWKDKIEKFLRTRNLLKDAKEARAPRVGAAHFVLIDGKLYKRGYSQPYLKCLPPREAEYVRKRSMREAVATTQEGNL